MNIANEQAGRATSYAGVRGSGKTVMLNAVEHRARERGWLVVSEAATRGFVARITQQHLPRLLRDFDPEAVRRRFSGLTAPLKISAVAWATVGAHVFQAGQRNQIELLADLLAERGTGVLLTLDEIHRNQVEELREVATTVHHAFRKGRELAFVGAGLAANVSDALNDEVLTLLRRAERHALSPVAQRHLGVDANYASQYRLRLIAVELIHATGHGYVDFALPYLREYLREHAVADL